MPKPPRINGPRPIVRPVKRKPVEGAETKQVEQPTTPPVQSTPVNEPSVSTASTPSPEPKEEARSIQAPPPVSAPSPVTTPPVAATPPPVSTPPAQESKPEAAIPQQPIEEKPISKISPDRKPEKGPAKREKESAKKESSSSSPVKTAVIVVQSIVIVLLLGGIGYLVMDSKDKDNILAEEVIKSSVLMTDVDSKVAEISRLQDSIKLVMLEKEALGQELEIERAKLLELEDLKLQVRNSNVSIRTLNNKLASIRKSEAAMSANLESLTAANKKLIAERESLKAILQSKQDSIKEMAGVQTKLSEKVALASVLQAENIDVAVINSAGKEVNTAKAMLTSKIKASLTFASNSITSHGKKEIYLRVIEPGGVTLYNGDKSIIVDGKKLAYTDVQTINF
ncbi:MAG: hypothetical protein ACK4ND_16410, partial [Cytophagaceae bacterium]